MNTLKPSIITISSDHTAAVAKLDVILAALKTNNKPATIPGLMILYKYAADCDKTDSKVTVGTVIAAIA